MFATTINQQQASKSQLHNIASPYYTYDNNGNLTSNGVFTNEWDYRNRLATTTHSGLTEKYYYDHTDSRIKFQNSTTTILYPFTFYSTSTTGTTTKYIVVT